MGNSPKIRHRVRNITNSRLFIILLSSYCNIVYFFVKRHVRIHCWKRRLFNFLIGFWMIRQIAEYGKFAYFIIYEIKLLKLYKTCNIIKKRFITTQKSTHFYEIPILWKKFLFLQFFVVLFWLSLCDLLFCCYNFRKCWRTCRNRIK